MIVSERLKFVYFAPIKTASTTIEAVLKSRYGPVKATSITSGKSSRNQSDLPERYHDYYKFATVRNPYDWEVSCFWFRHRHPPVPLPEDIKLKLGVQYFNQITFAQHVEHILPIKQSQSAWIRQHKGYQPPKGCVSFKIDKYIKVESLEQDFYELPFTKDKGRMPILNPTKDRLPPTAKFCKAVYTPELAEIVLDYRKECFDVFGYDYDLPSYLALKGNAK